MKDPTLAIERPRYPRSVPRPLADDDLAFALDHAPDGFTLDVNECGAALGLGGAPSRHSAMQRTLRRTLQFGVARAHNDHVIDVRRRLPPLNRTQVSRLPSSLRVAHDDWTNEELRRHEASRAAS